MANGAQLTARVLVVGAQEWMRYDVWSLGASLLYMYTGKTWALLLPEDVTAAERSADRDGASVRSPLPPPLLLPPALCSICETCAFFWRACMSSTPRLAPSRSNIPPRMAKGWRGVLTLHVRSDPPT